MKQVNVLLVGTCLHYWCLSNWKVEAKCQLLQQLRSGDKGVGRDEGSSQGSPQKLAGAFSALTGFMEKEWKEHQEIVFL